MLFFFQQYLIVPLPAHVVSIYDRSLAQYIEGYHRIYIKEQITPETLRTADHVGMKIWCHESSGGIFISAALKNALEQSDIKGVEFEHHFL
ncbi:MAG TPA: hypothetical protein VK518_20710 [Puia sp.]|nr:hypothetical protein [Puia sp.]